MNGFHLNSGRNHLGLGFLVAVLAVTGFASPASAQILYGAATGCIDCAPTDSTLYIIDSATGEATEVGPIGFDNVTGMAFVGDRLLATANGDDVFTPRSAILIEIDTATGEGTLIGEVDNDDEGLCGRMPDITYDLLAGILFAYSDRCGDEDEFEGLWTIDPETGEGTFVGASGFTSGGNGLAMEAGTGTLFATPEDDECLVIIDRDTGEGTCIEGSEFNVPPKVNALDFHPVTGELYGSLKFDTFGDEGVVSRLVVIDVSDGTTIVIGDTAEGLDAIAFFTPETADPASSRTFSGDVCFVATAAYGTPMADDINALRSFRDGYLLTSPLGTLFVDGYYRTSPPIADFVAKHPTAATMVRAALTPVVFVLSSPWMATAIALLLVSALVARRQVRVARVRVK